MGPEIIHYLPQKIDFLGTTVHMQTLADAVYVLDYDGYRHPDCSGCYESA